MIQKVNAETKPTIKKILRIGKLVSGKNRPIRVTLISQKDVRNIFFKTKQLVNLEIFKHLGFDKTKHEVGEYRTLKKGTTAQTGIWRDERQNQILQIKTKNY